MISALFLRQSRHSGLGRSALPCLAAAIWLAAGTSTAQSGVPGTPFDNALTGWSIVGVARGLAAPARAELRSTATQPTWIVSGPLEGVTPGAPFVLSLSLRSASGSAVAAISLVPATRASEAARYVAWRTEAGAGGKWRAVRLTLVPPAHGEKVRLALGVTGEGVWEFSDLKLSPRAQPKLAASPVPGLAPPSFPEPLPAGWTPEGSGDARVMQVGEERALELAIGSLRLTLPAEARARRGERTRVMVLVSNLAPAEKQLAVSVQGPEDATTPNFTVPVPAAQTLRLEPTVQPLQVGASWYKLTFECGGETKWVPLKVICERAHPFFGATWSPLEPLPGAAAAALAQIGVATHLLTGAPEGTAGLTGLTGELAFALPAGLVTAEALAGIRDGLGEAAKRLALIGLDLPVGADADGATLASQTAQLRELAASPLPLAVSISPPFDLAGGAALPNRLLEAVDAGLASNVGSLVVRATGLPTAAALLESEGKESAVSDFWTRFDAAWDPAPLRATLNERRAFLPLLLLPATGGIDGGRLDALMLGRLIASYAYQGATGVAAYARPQDMLTACGSATIPDLPITLLDEAGRPRPEISAVYAALARELAGAIPLTGTQQGPGFGVGGGAPLTYKPFLRGGDGIVVMWNNSATPVDVAVETRQIPVQLAVLRIGYDGELVQRQFQGMFQWSQEALDRRQQAVYVRVAPLEIVVVSLKLKSAHNAWLRSIGPMVEFTPGPRMGQGPEFFESSVWWRRKPEQEL